MFLVCIISKHHAKMNPYFSGSSKNMEPLTKWRKNRQDSRFALPEAAPKGWHPGMDAMHAAKIGFLRGIIAEFASSTLKKMKAFLLGDRKAFGGEEGWEGQECRILCYLNANLMPIMNP